MESSNAYQSGVRRVLLITLAFNLTVAIGKLIAGVTGHSLSIISDAIHSTVDSLNNIVGLVVVRYATADPDEGHPYGHAKFETLAAFIIAGFLFVTCYELATSALGRLFAGPVARPQVTVLTVGVMIATILCNVFVAIYEQRQGRRLQSEFLIADAIDTRSDVVVSCSILLGLVFVRMGYVWLDPVMTLLVAGVIAWNGYKIFKSTVPVLVDAAPLRPEEIAAVVKTVPGVHSLHAIRSRGRAGQMFIEMHLYVLPEIEHDHIKTHAVTESVEERLQQEFGNVTATIHVEPAHPLPSGMPQY